MAESAKFVRPGWFTAHVFNPLVGLTARLGFGLAGAQTLAVRGRRSGETRTTPVNPFEIEGSTYLLAPRGTTQWVRNIRASGEGELRSGSGTRRFRVTEIPDSEKLPLLRLYVEKWAWEVKALMGVEADASDEELREIAPQHPAFRLSFE